MPRKVQMYITNNHQSPRFAPNINNMPVEVFTNKNTGGLKSSSIIGRIYNVKPGCGSCGK